MKFGTSGLRGLVTDMTDAVCDRYVRAFLAHLAASGAAAGTMLIGRDLRPSSPRIAASCAAAAQEAGVAVIDCGVLPTPALALEAAARGAPAIMVTGSHIPVDRNGLKFYGPAGEITKDDEAGIRRLLGAGAVAAAPRGALSAGPDAVARYRARGVATLPPGALAGRVVGVYQHSAAGRETLPAVLEDCGARVVRLGLTDTFTPVDTEAVPSALEAQAMAWCAEHRLDALVSTDGDGDRPLVFDETGQCLRGDLLGILTARYLGADAVASTISCNTALERTGWFASVRRTKIGSPHVIAALEALRDAGHRRVMGFEPNGGFLLAGALARPHGPVLHALPTRDALLPILAVLAMAAASQTPLSALRARLPARFTASGLRPETPDALSAGLLGALAGDAAARDAFLQVAGLAGCAALDTLDGVRMTLDDGAVVHLRASGNAPELRCYAEADDEAAARAMVAGALAAAVRSGPA